MARARIYRGMTFEDDKPRMVYTMVTGQMADGTMVHTEVEQTEDGAIVMEDGEPSLMLDIQYFRTIKYGMTVFFRI